MAVTITVEDGSGITNANSFVTVADFTAYADDRGFTLPAEGKEVMLIKAMDYLKSLEGRYQGYRATLFQRLPFPRKGLYIFNDLVPDNAIPNEAKEGQMQAALEVAKGVDLMPTVSGAFIKREKVGPIETEYSETVGIGTQPSLTAVESILEILFGSDGGAFLTLRRI